MPFPGLGIVSELEQQFRAGHTSILENAVNFISKIYEKSSVYRYAPDQS